MRRASSVDRAQSQREVADSPILSVAEDRADLLASSSFSDDSGSNSVILKTNTRRRRVVGDMGSPYGGLRKKSRTADNSLFCIDGESMYRDVTFSTEENFHPSSGNDYLKRRYLVRKASGFQQVPDDSMAESLLDSAHLAESASVGSSVFHVPASDSLHQGLGECEADALHQHLSKLRVAKETTSKRLLGTVNVTLSATISKGSSSVDPFPNFQLDVTTAGVEGTADSQNMNSYKYGAIKGCSTVPFVLTREPMSCDKSPVFAESYHNVNTSQTLAVCKGMSRCRECGYYLQNQVSDSHVCSYRGMRSIGTQVESICAEKLRQGIMHTVVVGATLTPRDDDDLPKSTADS